MPWKHNTGLCRLGSRFWNGRGGGVAIIFGLAFLPIMMMLGVAVDYSRATTAKSRLQQAVDAAVLAGGVDQTASRDATALKLFNANFGSQYIGATATFSTDANGNYSGVASVSVPTAMMKIAHIDTIAVGASATAKINTQGVKLPICVMVTDPDSNHTLLVKNDATINFHNCMVQVNTENWDAVEARGASYIHSTNGENCFVGDIHYGDVQPPKDLTCTLFTDPFAGYVSTATTCDYTNKVVNIDNTTLLPGTYCGGLLINKSTTFSPGLYTIKDGDLHIVGSTTNVTANGVTFVLTGTNAAVNIETEGTINLTPDRNADAGVFAGFAIYLDATDEATKKKKKGGGSTIAKARMTASGIIYLAGQTLKITNHASVTVNPGSIVADYILPDEASLDLTGDINTSTSAEIAMQKVGSKTQTAISLTK